MDLEIVGRHALLFDDDATAEVVNSGGSLVPWAAVGAADLLLDRHDVRHLLDRVPPRPRRAYSAALRSAPSADGVSEAELDRERYLDLTAGDGEYEGSGDAAPSGNGTDTGQTGYNAVPFSYGYPGGSDEPNSSDLFYRPSFYVPESLLNKLEYRQPPSEKAHQIIARTALFVSEHGGQSEIVLRVKQGDNPTFGFLMPDHHLHSYFRYLVDHPQLLKDGADAVGTDKGNPESEHASSGGALSLLGTAYDSGDEDEGTLTRSSEAMNPGNSMTPDVQGHAKPASIMPDKKELGKDQNAAAPAVKSKTILMKKNPVLTGNSIVAAQREKVNDTITASSTSKSHTISGLPETEEMILEPPSFMKRTMEKIIEFILTNGKEFEEKLIEQDRTTGRFPFLLSSNPYHSYYRKFLQETEESKSHGRSPNHKDRRGSYDRRGRRSPESDDRSSRERADRSSRERTDGSSHDRADRSSRERGGRRCSMERKDSSYGMVSSASDRSSAGPSEKQLYDNDKQGKGRFHPVCGAKKEPTRKVTADEAAAIVMAATRGLGAANDSLNTMKGTKDNVRTHVSNDPSSSFGSFSSLQHRDALSKHISNSEADASLASSEQPQGEGFGIIDDDWIAKTIAKAAAAAASKEADSSEASMTKEQKLKAERLRRAKMFAAIIKSGDNKMNDLAAASDPTSEAAKAIPDMNVSGPDLQFVAKEREGSSAPFEPEGPNLPKHNKDSDDEQNRVRKYRKKRQESDEEKDDSEDSYNHSRKRHHPEHSRGKSKDVRKHKHKHKSHSKDRESRHHRHRYESLEDEHSKDRESRHHRHRYESSEDEQEQERRSSKSRHRHRDDHRYSDEEEHRRSHKHRRREHHSSSKRKHDEDRDQSEQSQGRIEVSPSRSGAKFESDKLPDDTAQSTQGTTEVPSELREKIRAMLLERL